MHPWVGLSDHVRLGVVTRWVTPALVAGVLEKCGVRDKKPGALPAGFMVYFTLALALFQQDSYDDVAEQLVGSMRALSGSIPNKSSFTRARRRLGPLVLETVFRELAGPLAPVALEGSFYRGMRLAAVDGFVLDAPDTSANRAAFGGPVKNGQPAGFPQVRVVTLAECGTHAQVDAAVGGFNGGERELAIALAGSASGMLVIMDRNFPGVALWKAYLGAGSHVLIRARSPVAHRPVEHLPDGTFLARMNLGGQKGAHHGGVVVRVIEYRVDGGEVVRLLTDLLDPVAFPAAELARLYRASGRRSGRFGSSRPSSAGRPRSCARETRIWCVRRCGRTWSYTTASRGSSWAWLATAASIRTGSPSSKSSSTPGAAWSASARIRPRRSRNSWPCWRRRCTGSSTTAPDA